MRAELDLITAGFDKLPTLTGNANKFVVVNSLGTLLEVTNVLPSLTVTDSDFTVQDGADNSKKFQFQASGITPSTTRTYTMPDANTTLVGTDATQTLTNKTLTAPVIATIVNTGTLTLPTSTDTLVGRATTDTLTNKTLTAPIIATIVNTGTLTLPTSTDTLVGRATTDTLTNKTLASPTITGTLSGVNLTLTGNTTLGDAAADTVTINGTATFNASPIISVTDNTNAALRITQLGTGNALLVEDSTNPDATPFVITADGRIVSGATSLYPSPINNANTDKLQLNGANTYDSSADFISWSTGTDTGTSLNLARSDSGTIGTHTVVGSADIFGNVRFFGSDGTNFIEGAKISAGADGAPGTNDMPGRLVFSTTADGASTVTERMRIDSSGQITIGGTSTAGVSVYLRKNLTGATTAFGVAQNVEIQSDVTTTANLFNSTYSTNASAFTLTNVNHYNAQQGTIGATSAVTNQYGFAVQSTLTGATNNYGFYGNIASGTGRYNFYADGTADNYFAGNVGIGTTTPVTKLEIAGDNTSTWTNTTTSISGTTMTVVGTVTGASVAVGDLIFGSGIQPYTRVTALGTGTGGAGTYTVSVSQTFASATVFGTAAYGNTIIRITDTDTAQAGGQPNGALQFYTSDASSPTAGVGAYVAGLAEQSTPDTALVFGTRDNAGGGIDANERMRIDSSGNVVIGYTATIAGSNSYIPPLQVSTGNTNNSGVGLNAFSAGSGTSFIHFNRSKSNTIGTNALVSINDSLGVVRFSGADNTNYIASAEIRGQVDGTPGTNDMPGRLTFYTTADGDNSPTERMRIDSSGNVLIGTSTSPAGTKELVLGGDYIEGVVAIGNSGTSKTIDLANGTVQTVTMTGNCTFTMPTAIAGKSFVLIVSTGAGLFTGTFTSVKWPNNTAPPLTITASRWDIFTFFSDGTNWYGTSAQAFQ
jgi:hypothetical protein